MIKANELLLSLKKSVFDSLPHYLYYHNFRHTQKVVDSAYQLAQEAQLVSEESEDLLFAAVFHDIGYVKSYDDNEGIAAEMASEFLQAEGLPRYRIDRVAEMILCTSLSVKPISKLDMLLSDADMAYMADADYLNWANDLLMEWRAVGHFKQSNMEWLTLQKNFLMEHRYRTPEAQNLFHSGKQMNIEKLKQLKEWPY